MIINFDKFNSEIFGMKMGNIILSDEDMNNTFDAEKVIQKSNGGENVLIYLLL